MKFAQKNEIKRTVGTKIIGFVNKLHKILFLCMFYIFEYPFRCNLDNIPDLTYNEDANFSLGFFVCAASGREGRLFFRLKTKKTDCRLSKSNGSIRALPRHSAFLVGACLHAEKMKWNPPPFDAGDVLISLYLLYKLSLRPDSSFIRSRAYSYILYVGRIAAEKFI